MVAFLPDLKNPSLITRTFMVCKEGQDDRSMTLTLVVLVESCLYLLWEETEGVRAGTILSRNLDLTSEKGYDVNVPEQQVFVQFSSLFDASRAFSRIFPRYNEKEVPELGQWKGDADRLMRWSWTISRARPDEEALFVACANERVARHKRDRNKLKVEARERTERAGQIKDTTGRPNTTRIPLICGAVERRLHKRTHAVRGIGRRMDWRAVVIQNYLDQLRDECFGIRRAAQSALISKEIFVSGSRKAPKMLALADRMMKYAQTLKTLRARPFIRRFVHASRELEEASRLLVQSATTRDGAAADLAKAQLEITYRSMCLFDDHWILEEMLAVVSLAFHRKQPLTSHQIQAMSRELREMWIRLTSPEPVTGKMIEEGFKRPDTVREAVENIRCCIEDLNASTVDIKQIRLHLKAARKPL